MLSNDDNVSESPGFEKYIQNKMDEVEWNNVSSFFFLFPLHT